MNSSPAGLPAYDISRTYRWNYEHAPDPVDVEVPAVPGEWRFCGLSVGSPLGVPAGPLLNGKWILYYASLGFDVLTYKTVRSVQRECYPLPNLLPVRVGQLSGDEDEVPAGKPMRGSWAVSFGMPSQLPGVWRADIEQTRKRLPPGKVLSVSVVGTVQEGWTIDDLADDYARCARWAVESGAHCVETNFSCPNVATCDGQLYQQPDSAATIAAKVREAIGATQYIIKIGHLTDESQAAALLEALAPHIDAVAMTNSVATRVRGEDGSLYFDGRPRGICGEATRKASIEQVRLFARLLQQRVNTSERPGRSIQSDRRIELIGVGGASTAGHIREYVAVGASAVHIATAAMRDPLVAVKIRRDL